MLAALKIPGLAQSLRDASPAAVRTKRKAKGLAHPSAASRKAARWVAPSAVGLPPFLLAQRSRSVPQLIRTAPSLDACARVGSSTCVVLPRVSVAPLTRLCAGWCQELGWLQNCGATLRRLQQLHSAQPHPLVPQQLFTPPPPREHIRPVGSLAIADAIPEGQTAAGVCGATCHSNVARGFVA